MCQRRFCKHAAGKRPPQIFPLPLTLPLLCNNQCFASSPSEFAELALAIEMNNSTSSTKDSAVTKRPIVTPEISTSYSEIKDAALKTSSPRHTSHCTNARHQVIK